MPPFYQGPLVSQFEATQQPAAESTRQSSPDRPLGRFENLSKFRVRNRGEILLSQVADAWR
jgi:hypothetical protein